VGGYGSGRPRRNQLAEHCRKLDVNRLNREGCLQPGWSGNWRWHNNGVQVAGISLSAQQSQLVVSFRITEKTGDHYDVQQSISIIRSPCNYGGKLFKGGRYFLCRHCYRVAYASQSEDDASRMLRRANSLRMALGGEPGTAYWIAPKPKGMWQRTYEKHCSEIEWFENQADHHFVAKFSHLLSKEDRERCFGD
jgi:hypothetical protein